MSDLSVSESETAQERVKQLPFSFASRHGVFLSLQQEPPVLYYKYPGLKSDVFAEVRRYLGQSFSAQALSVDEFQKQLSLAYQKSSSEAAQAAEDIGADMDLTRLAEQIPETSDLMSGEDDAPVIRLINAILSQAVREKASDIHVETFETDLVVRFRIDGVLTEILRPKRMLAPLLISRLKVMAKMDIAEKRIPQDTRISIP